MQDLLGQAFADLVLELAAVLQQGGEALRARHAQKPGLAEEQAHRGRDRPPRRGKHVRDAKVEPSGAFAPRRGDEAEHSAIEEQPRGRRRCGAGGVPCARGARLRGRPPVTGRASRGRSPRPARRCEREAARTMHRLPRCVHVRRHAPSQFRVKPPGRNPLRFRAPRIRVAQRTPVLPGPPGPRSRVEGPHPLPGAPLRVQPGLALPPCPRSRRARNSTPAPRMRRRGSPVAGVQAPRRHRPHRDRVRVPPHTRGAVAGPRHRVDSGARRP